MTNLLPEISGSVGQSGLSVSLSVSQSVSWSVSLSASLSVSHLVNLTVRLTDRPAIVLSVSMSFCSSVGLT